VARNHQLKILKISKHLEHNHILFGTYVSVIYNFTYDLYKDYPNYFKWYWTKVVPGVIERTREIMIATMGNDYAGIIIVKNENGERKICTLFIAPKYRNQGIASILVHEAVNYLGTTKPLITIPEYKLEQFASIIENYGWEQTQVLEKGYYSSTSRELVFNGTIP